MTGTDVSSIHGRPGRVLVATFVLGLGLAACNGAKAAEDPVISPRGQDVTIIQGEERTVYEYRQNGELRMIRVVPSTGRPYYLVPSDETRGYGNLERADMLIPKWILVEF
ncbi:MAG: DUF2782 domain-containing protein [Pseudomonadales bacterium]|nr:DUF2782 domain-containing protein [Pseudomonadales bacterium]